jgi:hypothetical protein
VQKIFVHFSEMLMEICYTHRIFNNYCFSAAESVTRTHLDIMLHVKYIFGIGVT